MRPMWQLPHPIPSLKGYSILKIRGGEVGKKLNSTGRGAPEIKGEGVLRKLNTGGGGGGSPSGN